MNKKNVILILCILFLTPFLGVKAEEQKSDLTISNIKTTNITNSSALLSFNANGDYVCTLIHSTKDANLEDDALYADRDKNDLILAYVTPKSGSGSSYYYEHDYSFLRHANSYGSDIYDLSKGVIYYKFICDKNNNDGSSDRVISEVHSLEVNALNIDAYPGFSMSVDKKLYSIDDVAYLQLGRADNKKGTYDIDLYGNANVVGGNSEKFLIKSGVSVGELTTVAIELNKFSQFKTHNGGDYEYSLIICPSINGCVEGSTNAAPINIKKPINITKVDPVNMDNGSVKINWMTNGDYDCTVIYSTKDSNLDDDFLTPTRDEDDMLFGSNRPASDNNGVYFYNLNLDKNHLKGDGGTLYYNFICYDDERNKGTSPVYSFKRIIATPDLEVEDTTNTKTISTVNDAQIIQIKSKAKNLIEDQFNQILIELNELRDIVKEQATEIKYLRYLKKDVQELSATIENAINNFITYGVDSNTQKLGAGERAAVMYSYKSAFNKLPETEEELADAIKIANGRWPSLTNNEAEKRAKKQFEKIYKKIADMNDSKDNAAITVMAYGLRQKAENRNLESEKQGIKIFTNIYGYHPASTDDWNIMQAITYSGSSRGIDTDGDLLTDDREKELGTDVNNKDTDGDGYLDGVEVANGHDPLKK